MHSWSTAAYTYICQEYHIITVGNNYAIFNLFFNKILFYVMFFNVMYFLIHTPCIHNRQAERDRQRVNPRHKLLQTIYKCIHDINALTDINGQRTCKLHYFITTYMQWWTAYSFGTKFCLTGVVQKQELSGKNVRCSNKLTVYNWLSLTQLWQGLLSEIQQNTASMETINVTEHYAK